MREEADKASYSNKTIDEDWVVGRESSTGGKCITTGEREKNKQLRIRDKQIKT